MPVINWQVSHLLLYLFFLPLLLLATIEVKGFCNTKGVKDQKQVLTEKLLITSSLEDCQSECLSSPSTSTSTSSSSSNIGFTCRSFTYESSSRTCSLSHHSSKSSSSLVKSNSSHVYFEISSCFEGKTVMISSSLAFLHSFASWEKSFYFFSISDCNVFLCENFFSLL